MRKPSREHLEFLAAFAPHITELTLAVRALVLEEAPDANELIYDAYNAVAAGYSFTGRPSDAFIHIASYAKWVNLGFNKGAHLHDPDFLLEGNGRFVRHLRMSSLDDVKQPHVREFVRMAVAIAPNAEEGGGGETFIRAIYPQRRRPDQR
ncbi:MAG: DUF1801 domain-containing protein [Acidobacteria bacterium]|nr:DUF1801 domain-containing protein [Acidobacteriota bacterium]